MITKSKEVNSALMIMFFGVVLVVLINIWAIIKKDVSSSLIKDTSDVVVYFDKGKGEYDYACKAVPLSGGYYLLGWQCSDMESMFYVKKNNDYTLLKVNSVYDNGLVLMREYDVKYKTFTIDPEKKNFVFINMNNCPSPDDNELEFIAFGIDGKQCNLKLMNYSGDYSSNCTSENAVAGTFLKNESGNLCFARKPSLGDSDSSVFFYLGD